MIMEQEPNNQGKDSNIHPLWTGLATALGQGTLGSALDTKTPIPKGTTLSPQQKKYGRLADHLATFIQLGVSDRTAVGGLADAIGHRITGNPVPGQTHKGAMATRFGFRSVFPIATTSLHGMINASSKEEPMVQDAVQKARVMAFGGEKGGYAVPQPYVGEGEMVTFLRSPAGKNRKRDVDAIESGEWDAGLNFASGLKNIPAGNDRYAAFEELSRGLISGQIDPSAAFNDLRMISDASMKKEEKTMREKAAQSQSAAAVKDVEKKLKERGEASNFYLIPGYTENWTDDPQYANTRAMVGVMLDPKTNNAQQVAMWYDPKDRKRSGTIVGPLKRE